MKFTANQIDFRLDRFLCRYNKVHKLFYYLLATPRQRGYILQKNSPLMHRCAVIYFLDRQCNLHFDYSQKTDLAIPLLMFIENLPQSYLFLDLFITYLLIKQ